MSPVEKVIEKISIEFVRSVRRRWIRVIGIKRRGDLAVVLCRDENRNEEFALRLERSRMPGDMTPTWSVVSDFLDAEKYRQEVVR